jgi:hypothetical protein
MPTGAIGSADLSLGVGARQGDDERLGVGTAAEAGRPDSPGYRPATTINRSSVNRRSVNRGNLCPTPYDVRLATKMVSSWFIANVAGWTGFLSKRMHISGTNPPFLFRPKQKLWMHCPKPRLEALVLFFRVREKRPIEPCAHLQSVKKDVVSKKCRYSG